MSGKHGSPTSNTEMVRRALTITAFAAVILTAYIGGSRYLANRLIFEPQLSEPWTTILFGMFLVLAVTPALQALAERVSPPSVSRFVAWPANLFLGMAFYLLIGLFAADVTLLLVGAAVGDDFGLVVPRSRALAVVVFAAIAAVVGMSSALAPPRIHKLSIHLARWPAALDGLRIVQISDIHIGSMLDARFARSIVDRVNALTPDLIAVTGDLVDGPVKHLRDDVAPFADLRAPHGVFFVTGNHDYYSGADPWLDHVRELGMQPLRNERVTISHEGAHFELAGVDDHRANLFGPGHGEDVPTALAGRDPADAVVLLAHDPSTFSAAIKADVDLQLSGHTHGGQIWPFNLLVKAAVGFVAGHYRRGTSQLLVSRGTGYWGPPMRLRAPAEILEITLHPESIPATRAA